MYQEDTKYKFNHEIDSTVIESHDKAPAPAQNIKKIVLAACTGTLIEWYDFFIFGTLCSNLGSMASEVSSKFYNSGSKEGDLIVWLATFAAGVIARPIGAFIFGYFGDTVGRKYTFILTLLITGSCTFAVGCLPTYSQAGPISG
jgi:MFS family permease